MIDEWRKGKRLRDLVTASVDMRASGGYGQMVGCCPFHKDRTPSFTLYAPKADGRVDYFCFGCKAAGDLIDWLVAYNGMSIAQAMKLAEKDYGVK